MTAGRCGRESAEYSQNACEPVQPNDVNATRSAARNAIFTIRRRLASLATVYTSKGGKTEQCRTVGTYHRFQS